mmetsp:Transcript_19297/g.50222  ORF Transcript_19297/g.50222 Transcript_19297/m.50222 type:complete len:393 (+) Transcript_19297:309-1487(+)
MLRRSPFQLRDGGDALPLPKDARPLPRSFIEFQRLRALRRRRHRVEERREPGRLGDVRRRRGQRPVRAALGAADRFVGPAPHDRPEPRRPRAGFDGSGRRGTAGLDRFIIRCLRGHGRDVGDAGRRRCAGVRFHGEGRAPALRARRRQYSSGHGHRRRGGRRLLRSQKRPRGLCNTIRDLRGPGVDCGGARAGRAARGRRDTPDGQRLAARRTGPRIKLPPRGRGPLYYNRGLLRRLLYIKLVGHLAARPRASDAVARGVGPVRGNGPRRARRESRRRRNRRRGRVGRDGPRGAARAFISVGAATDRGRRPGRGVDGGVDCGRHQRRIRRPGSGPGRATVAGLRRGSPGVPPGPPALRAGGVGVESVASISRGRGRGGGDGARSHRHGAAPC